MLGHFMKGYERFGQVRRLHTSIGSGEAMLGHVTAGLSRLCQVVKIRSVTVWLFR
jgi:hypothetical protein